MYIATLRINMAKKQWPPIGARKNNTINLSIKLITEITTHHIWRCAIIATRQPHRRAPVTRIYRKANLLHQSNVT